MLLQVRELSVGFRRPGGEVAMAVDRLSFDLEAGRILGVVGESGSGKTLSQLAVMGLIGDPNAVVSGSIRLEGQELVGLSPRAFRRLRGNRMAMIFQDPMTALTPVHSIGAQIAEQIRAHRSVSARAAMDRAVELLGLMGMASPGIAARRYPHQLSGGMRQRAMIAMALSCDPALLIADEPTTALDVTVQAQILQLLLRLRTQFGSSIILITHDMGVVAETADVAMVMYAGRAVERAGREALFERPGHPYTIGLLGSVPPMHGRRAARLAAIPGTPPLPGEIGAGCAFAPRCAHVHARCAVAPPLLRAGGHEMACWLAEDPNWPKLREAPP